MSLGNFFFGFYETCHIASAAAAKLLRRYTLPEKKEKSTLLMPLQHYHCG